jgi:hypothetical protein
MPRPLVWGFFVALVLLSLAIPAAAQSAPDSSTLSVSDRLDERRFVTTGTRAYEVGTEAGRYPAMGFHTRGEMGGVWSPPIKLLDGLWFGIDDEWIGPAERFTSGYGHVKMDLPEQDGMTVERTDFVPDGKRAVLVGLEFAAGDADQSFTLKMDAHSELMGAYPWGETNPSQTVFNKQDAVTVEDGKLVFRERESMQDVPNALPHDWAAVVGSNLTPTGSDTGEDFRGPQEPVGPDELCPASGPDTPAAPPRCDDTAYGKGAGGQLRYDVTVPANTTETVWFAVAGADFDGKNPADAKAQALAQHEAALTDPGRSLQKKLSERLALRDNTRLTLPGDERLVEGIDWSKQNLADSVQLARDLEIRETNAGKNYPAPVGDLAQMRFLGAGFPDYQWLFGTDGEYTAFASVGVGQFEPIKDHLRALKAVSLIDNGNSGKVVHEVVTDGSVYFGSNADAGNTDETAKFPSAVALIWRWTGDNKFRDEMYAFTKSNMEYIFRELDKDGDGWPEGLGNVERSGMGEEKLDNTVYTIRGLYDLADMAQSKGDVQTAAWAQEKARGMESRFEAAWWFGQAGATQYGDSIDDPANPANDNQKIFQRHWIGVTPMEAELVDVTGNHAEPVPGLASFGHGDAALGEREEPCYTDIFGMYHTGTGPTSAPEGNPGPSCDVNVSTVRSERAIFTLNTAIMAVGEGNYGRLGEDQQQHYMYGNVNLQLDPPDEQPGAMPEIAPSPDYSLGGSIDRPFNERAMVLQAWGAYGTIWPVVHQWLGVRPDLGRGALEIVPQVPPDSSGPISGDNIRLGKGSVAVTADATGDTYTTTVDPDVRLRELFVGHTVPRDGEIASVTLDGEPVDDYMVRSTNRGKEVLVKAAPGEDHTLVAEVSS